MYVCIYLCVAACAFAACCMLTVQSDDCVVEDTYCGTVCLVTILMRLTWIGVPLVVVTFFSTCVTRCVYTPF